MRLDDYTLTLAIPSSPLSPQINLPELAATTLLLALQQQRNNDKKAARSTFNNFFKIATEFYSDETTIRMNPSTDHEHEDCICGCGKGCTARVIQGERAPLSRRFHVKRKRGGERLWNVESDNTFSYVMLLFLWLFSNVTSSLRPFIF